jgi:hypothetical protein
MSKAKKQARADFRKVVFARAHDKCEIPGCGKPAADAPHIVDRHDAPDGGYVRDNGIAVCPECHLKCEVFHDTGTALPGFHPDDLFRYIQH